MEELKSNFGSRLRALRRNMNLTQEEIAEAIQVTVEFISNLERGINAPSFKTLVKLSVVLKVKIKDFFDFDEPG